MEVIAYEPGRAQENPVGPRFAGYPNRIFCKVKFALREGINPADDASSWSLTPE